MRYILKISYDGSNYSGFQRQKNKVTIQELLENSLYQVFRKQIDIIPSGRTDAGVSAFCQVCHFDIDEEININRTKGYLNNLLPKDIRVLSIENASLDFHARYSSKKKTYEYYFYIGKDIIPVYENFATNIGYDINIDNMVLASKFLVGEHDFTSFCASNTEVVNKVRIIYAIDIINLDNNLFKLVITGSGFLYNMVRIVMGTLVSVGIGKLSVDSISDIIDGKDRSLAGKTMPSKGLYLKNVEY